MSLADMHRQPWQVIILDPAKWPEGSLPGALARAQGYAGTELWMVWKEGATWAAGGRFFRRWRIWP